MTVPPGLVAPSEEPCRYHGRGAVCDQCPAAYVTNGYGFPHFPATSRLERLRVCNGCDTAKGVAEWAWSLPGGKAPRCLSCSAGGTT